MFGVSTQPHNTARSLALLGLAVLVGACPPPQTGPVPVRTTRLANRSPVIQALMLASGGQRLRYPRAGIDLEVRVLARDPDGDHLRYQWVSVPDSGQVTITGPSTARWSVPKNRPDAALHIRVTDPRGQFATRVLTPTSDPALRFGGEVLDPDGQPISGVSVRTGDDSTRTDRQGRFALELPDSGQQRFVLNLGHPDYGPVSQVITEPAASGRWVMAKASVTPAAFQQAVTARVAAGSCASTLSSRVTWSSFPRQHSGVTLQEKRAFHASVPPELAEALEWAEAGTGCPAGFSVSIGPNALVPRSGGGPVASGQIALTQIPALGAGSMPGDYGVRLANGQRRVMWSYGAASISASSNGQPLQLAKGQRATLQWPVQRRISASRLPLPVPREVPLLRYDEENGEWEQTGVARLDKAGTSWIAEVGHFSTFNLDLLKVNQACVRVDAGGLTDASIALEVTIPGDPFPVVRNTTLDNATTTLHALYNLPADAWIALRPFRDAGGTPVPLGTFIVNTGGPQQPTDPNRPDYPYDACQAEVQLLDLGASVLIANRDNDPSQAGLLVPVYMGIVNRTSGDLFPTGPTGFPVVGIYDMGSNSVYVTDDPRANAFTGSTVTDADLLGVTTGTDATFRVTPVDLAPTPATAPMGPPGSPNAASAEVPQVLIRSGSGKDLSLTGTPFVRTQVAYLDFGVGVTIPGSTEIGAWSRYFLPGAPGIPLFDIEMNLVRFGSYASPAPGGYTRGERFLLQGVTFYHGTRRAGHAVSGSTDGMFFDNGTTWTAIGNAIANGLSLSGQPSYGACLAAGRLYRVDRVELVGTGGKYVISDAMVCWDESVMAQIAGGASPDYSEAIIGSNLFRRVAIVIDGPGNRLGILRP